MVGCTCRKQATVSLSTMEADFTSASHAGQELLGLREHLSELGVVVELPMKIEMYNEAAIRQMENEESSARAKHIDIKRKFPGLRQEGDIKSRLCVNRDDGS